MTSPPEASEAGLETAPRTLPLGAAARRVLLVGGDLVVVAVLVTLALRLGAVRSGWPWSTGFLLRQAGWYVLLGGLWVGLAAVNGLYDLRHAPDRWRAAVLSLKVSLQILLVWAVAYFIPPPWTLVRHVVVIFTAGAAVAMPAWRQLYAVVLGRPAFRRRVLIVGAGQAGRTVLAAMRAEAPHDFATVGFIDDDPAKQGATIDGLPVIGGRDVLLGAARRAGVTEVVVAVTNRMHGALFRVLMDARERGLTVTPMPVLYESMTGRVPVEHIGDHWAVALPLDPPSTRGLYPLVSRVIDLVLAALGLVLLGLLAPLVAVLVRLDSRGPLLYRQRRVGRAGRPFTLLKLRSMVDDAEPDGAVWASPDDPRVTAVGRWLRRTRLDELPQVINILRGEMSVVGPRPERPEFVSALAEQIPFYRARHAVRPGLTGWATVQQGYAGSTADALLKLQYDLYYIKHQSLLLDANIVLRTLATVVRLRGR